MIAVFVDVVINSLNQFAAVVILLGDIIESVFRRDRRNVFCDLVLDDLL